jgi:hypothetical protein
MPRSLGDRIFDHGRLFWYNTPGVMADEAQGKPLRRSAFRKEQKACIILIFLIGLFGVIFGVKSFPASLRRPFDLKLASYTGPEFLTENQKESREVERQKISDTDEDGLVDYDELYVFKTSPYSADSDSDGFDDKTELYSGNNPNCPTGKDCGETLVESADAAASDFDAVGYLRGVLNVDERRFEGVDIQSEEDLRKFFATLGIEEVKSLLRAQGVPDETIDKLDEETLMELFASAVDQAIAGVELSPFTEEEEASLEGETE